MHCFVSVVIPVYNVEKYLSACLDSLVISARKIEDCEQVEVVCIDDGSTDGSGEILDRFQQRVTNGDVGIVPVRLVCRVIHQKNSGLGPARNVGLDKAQGEWVAFVDSDDVVAPAYFHELLRMDRAFKPDAIVFSHIPVDEAGKNINIRSHAESNETLYTTYEGIYESLGSRFACNVAYRRVLIGANRFENITPGEDALFTSSMLSRVRKVVSTDQVLYCYRQRTGSLMHQPELRLSQIRSVDISLLGRIKNICGWEGFPVVRRNLYVMVRTSFIGQLYMGLAYVSEENKSASWELYCEIGRKICECGKSFIPFSVRAIWRLIFHTRSRFLFCLLAFLPWRIRVCLLRVPFVVKVKRLIRGEGAKS